MFGPAACVRRGSRLPHSRPRLHPPRRTFPPPCLGSLARVRLRDSCVGTRVGTLGVGGGVVLGGGGGVLLGFHPRERRRHRRVEPAERLTTPERLHLAPQQRLVVLARVSHGGFVA